MHVYLFGGPGNGCSFDAYGNPHEVVFQEDGPIGKFDGNPMKAEMPPIHIYARINRSPMFAHDCSGRCEWPDIRGHRIRAGDEHEPPLHLIEGYLRNWARWSDQQMADR